MIGRIIKHNIVLSMAVSFSSSWVSTWLDPTAKSGSLAGGPAANHNQLITIPPASGQAIVSVKTFIYLVVFSLSAGFYHSYSIEFKMAAWSSFSNTLAATYRVRKRPEIGLLCKRERWLAQSALGDSNYLRLPLVGKIAAVWLLKEQHEGLFSPLRGDESSWHPLLEECDCMC